uniref:Radical SAM superfamily protein n=1 Tax=viral metagenome TaxID=1070528 RepID=A0A6H1ZSH8_9ZZZZ
MRKKDLIKALQETDIQIYPVLKCPKGKIIDGKHRKKANPNWFETIVEEASDPLVFQKIRLQANTLRRDVKVEEKRKECLNFKEELERRSGRPVSSITELAQALGIPRRTVSQWIGGITVAASATVSLRGLGDSKVEWCDYGISHYIGCYHNCSYCYSKAMNQRFGWIENWSQPKPKMIYWQDLKRSVERAEAGRIFFCPACDAYQPLEAEKQLSRRILEEVLLPSKHLTLILTKSDLVMKDYDIISQYNNVHVGFTIISLEKNPQELNSPVPSARIRALKEAKNLGITTFVSIEPWVPGITNPIEIIAATKEFVDYYIIGSLQYRGNEEAKRNEYIESFSKLFNFLISNNIEYYLKDELWKFFKTNVEWKW